VISKHHRPESTWPRATEGDTEVYPAVALRFPIASLRGTPEPYAVATLDGNRSVEKV
jgi:hypothetical protein